MHRSPDVAAAGLVVPRGSPVNAVEPPSPSPDPGSVTGAATMDQAFDMHGLSTLRDMVARHAVTLDTAPDLVQRLLLVTGELTANAVRYAGGHGRLRLWHEHKCLYLEVTDHGPGLADPTIGTRRPEPTALGGRGIWMCRQLTHDLRIATSTNGTTVLAIFELDD